MLVAFSFLHDFMAGAFVFLQHNIASIFPEFYGFSIETMAHRSRALFHSISLCVFDINECFCDPAAVRSICLFPALTTF